MKIQDICNESYQAVIINKVRSSLTILGIVIGIASVIAMVGIGQGAQSSVEASIESIGSNLLSVIPGVQEGFSGGASLGHGSAETLERDDAEAIEDELDFVEAVSPEISTRAQITAGDVNTQTQMYGVTASYAEVRSVTTILGSFISNQQEMNRLKVAVLGPTTRDDLFGENADPIGETIRINSMTFTVIGVTESKGGTGFANQDDMVFVPLSTAQQYFTGESTVSTISVKAINSESMNQLEDDVTKLLLDRHDIDDADDADFSILNQADIVSTASSITSTFTVLLATIAGISLLVGGIGIMNMMLTTVTERTKEIGLRKAIGATVSDIRYQFLMEAILLTFSGGLCGVFLGWLFSVATEKFTSIGSEVNTSSIALALSVSISIGIIFGYYPARRASRLHPIEALRFE